jgi:asparagine synthetase B (glutamine-hydrolysing)
LMHQRLPENEPIELCSICFASDGTSPDRIGALDAYRELKERFPEREWRFIAVDSNYDELRAQQQRLMNLLCPCDEVMDFNIGGALWLATSGMGKLIDTACPDTESSDVFVVQDKYSSKARVVFLGHGADEAFGGYGRHRTRYMRGGWRALAEELRMDVRRIWKRNFGRDDRVVSDHGKEARLPFMDEQVLEFALTSPLNSLMNLNLSLGEGDKMILRRCLQLLGLHRASWRHKRAMQFGTRLAKASNEALFGSNTQANRHQGGGRAKIKHQPE